MSGSAATVVVRGLCRTFGEHLALAPFDLEMRPGEITGLIGPNGSGKSTLLRCITGLVPPDSGSASVDGVALTGDGTAVRRVSTYSPGEIAVYGELRAEEHIQWLLRGRGADAVRRATSTARELELPLRERVRTYSHGMKRQLYLACALAPDVRVRFLDEITEGLDPAKRGLALELLKADASQGRAILLSSHHLGEVDRVCDRMVFMQSGIKLSEEKATDIARRARRVVLLRFATAESATGAASEYASGGFEVARVNDTLLRVRLEDEDPRSALGVLASNVRIETPVSLRYGELSLEELYRDLYGVEAC